MSTKTKTDKSLIASILGNKVRSEVTLASDEGEWNQHTANSGMARVFVIMLLLHVVLIGSIIVYDFIGTDETSAPPARTVATTSQEQPANATNAAVNAAPAPKALAVDPATLSPTDKPIIPVSEEHEVSSTDSIPKIAARYGVSIEDLIAVNNLGDANAVIKPLTILKIPAVKINDPAKIQPIQYPDQAPVAAQKETSVIPIEEPAPAPTTADQTPKAEPIPAVTSLADAPPAAPVKATPASGPATPQSTPPAPKPAEAKPVAATPSTPAKPAETKTVPKATPVVTNNPGSHIMAKGDTLYSLARKYGVSVTAIQNANNIKNPNAIREGTKLVIPAKR
jgi:LysM repeat protein